MNTYIIHYIGASWCSTCKVIRPSTEALAKKFSVPLVCYDVDDDLTEEEKDTITKVPTLRIFRHGEKVAEFNVKQVESLDTWLKANISLATDDF
jgi:thiol-disulfide isomerase/thioredoxin